MTTHSHKATQYWHVALKVLVLVLALGYLFVKVRDNVPAVSPLLEATLGYDQVIMWTLFVAAASLNWFFEILKWQNSASIHYQISFVAAAKQSLGSLTASLITPNRLGEYGAKAMYYAKEKRKKIVFLNFIHNGSQMLVTLVFGLPALLYFLWAFRISMNTEVLYFTAFIASLLLLIGYFFRKEQLFIKGLSLSNLWKHFREIPNRKKGILILLSVLRYLVFSTLFYVLLTFFGASASYTEVAPIIFCMYLLVSIVPTYFVFDVVIRGGAGVWLFSFVGVSELPVLATVFTMWLLNVVLPALIGSYYVLTFKSVRS